MFIICILSDEKYQHFQDVLTTYIEKHFSAALAHKYVQHTCSGGFICVDCLLAFVKTVKSVVLCKLFEKKSSATLLSLDTDSHFEKESEL